MTSMLSLIAVVFGIFVYFDVTTCTANPMKFELQGNGGNSGGSEWLSADGDFTDETPKDLERAVDEVAATFGRKWRGTIAFNSPGGSLAAGLKVGEFIRRQGMSTSVGKSKLVGIGKNIYELTPGICASACAFAFLGGVARDLSGGPVGVHQFYDDALFRAPTAKIFDALDLSAQQAISGLIVDYVHRMGVDPRFVAIASATPPTSMHFFSKDEAQELHVSFDSDKFEEWKIEAYGSGLVAFSRTQGTNSTVTLFCKSDRTPRLLATVSNAMQPTDYESARSAVKQINVGTNVYGSDAISLNFRGDRKLIEIKAPNLTIPDSKDGKDEDFLIVPSDDTPRFAVGYFVFSLPLKHMKQISRLALRNCI